MLIRSLLVVAQLLCLLTDFDPPGGSSTEKPRTQSVTKPPNAAPGARTPEEVLSAFLTAMMDDDQEGIRRMALPNPELSVLWHGEPLTAAQKAVAKAAFNPSYFRRLKVGDPMRIPRGRKIVLDKRWINERRLAITMPDGPLPFFLVKIKDEWKVDASSVIAGRLAAAAVGERHKAAGRPNWVTDETTWSALTPTGYDGMIDEMKNGIESRPKPLVWAILNCESQIELHVGLLAPFLDGDVVVAGSRTELLGKLRACETEKALGLRLDGVGHAIQLEMTFAPKPGT